MEVEKKEGRETSRQTNGFLQSDELNSINC